MNEKKKENKYGVTLDSSKCMSYSLDGVKYVADRQFFKKKEDLKKFYEAGVFLISEHCQEAQPKKAEPLENAEGDETVEPTKLETPEGGEGGETGEVGKDEKETEGGDDQSLLPDDPNVSSEANGQGDDGEGRPSGVITSSSLTK